MSRRVFLHQRFLPALSALESVKKVRILIGLKNEQVVHGLIQIARDGASEGAPSIAEIKATFGGMLRKELVQADDTLAIETGVRKFIEWIRSGKLEVKLYREQNIHAKVYILTPEHPVESVNHGYVITGSSNLSHSGLEGNLEFNVLLAEPEEHDYALHRFNELWRDGVDVKDVHDAIITTVEQESPFAFFTPYELYLRFLAEYFRDYLGDRSKLNAVNLPQNFKKLSYQEDAVFTAQQMLKTYGGVFIADVVGLGKTFMSALLALQLDGRCLIIAPPSLLDENSPGSWARVFRDFCVPGHKCVSIGKLEEVIEQGVEFYKYVMSAWNTRPSATRRPAGSSPRNASRPPGATPISSARMRNVTRRRAGSSRYSRTPASPPHSPRSRRHSASRPSPRNSFANMCGCSTTRRPRSPPW